MKAYRRSTNLKLGLVVFAVAIALASLLYTNRLVDRLREREQFIISLWASAREGIASASLNANPYLAEFQELDALVAGSRTNDFPAARVDAYRDALVWARSMPPPGEVNLAGEILTQGSFGIPSVIIDSSGAEPAIQAVQNLRVPADSLQARRRVLERAAEMARRYPPIPIEFDFGDSRLQQYIFYDDSQLVREMRIFPYIQLLFVSLFVLVGYLGFSYIRRSEQGSLWVGMAKEAAHQLGTPLSSLMGWHELLKMADVNEETQHQALDEIEKDIGRLRRVANRFSDIGSVPKLEPTRLLPVVEGTAEYMRRRFPQYGKKVHLAVSVPGELSAPVNAELFDWVLENLLKNALDAIETKEGSIGITAVGTPDAVRIEVSDSGRGIERNAWKNVFRPGYSTKKRGWGLGLSLAKRIVEDYHGGALTLVQSRPGVGTTFRIELPAAGKASLPKRRKSLPALF